MKKAIPRFILFVMAILITLAIFADLHWVGRIWFSVSGLTCGLLYVIATMKEKGQR